MASLDTETLNHVEDWLLKVKNIRDEAAAAVEGSSAEGIRDFTNRQELLSSVNIGLRVEKNKWKLSA